MEQEIRNIHLNGGVEVLKASAGSGKTFSLAREYIRLLLQQDSEGHRDDRSYRHILAVTFTNKATGEMKGRIIGELHKLAGSPMDSDFREYLLEHCGFTGVDELQKWSAKLLSGILNDYGAFSVSTIDKFFQSTLRAFSREIGQFAEYQIELDRKSLVAEASARVLDSLSEDDRDLLRWISDGSIRSLEDGNGYRLGRMLADFAEGYMSASYADKVKEGGIDEAEAFSQENIRKLDRICRSIISDYRNALTSALQKAYGALEGLSGVKAALPKALDKLSGIDHRGVISVDGISQIAKTASDGNEGFTAKAKAGAAEISALQEACRGIMDLLSEPLRIRNTAVQLSGQSYVFRVADALKREFNALLKEKNVLCLDDTNEILKGIIGDTDAPFIYEKTGTRYRHFLLDEFQDTSRIQWENFINLLKNSISEGCYNLIVGDVKQSIYRWRNSDWKILDEEVERDLPGTFAHPLDHNWRSARNIVEFNNSFFRELALHMDANLGRNLPDGSPDTRIRRIYSDVGQKVTGAVGMEGCVEATFCDGSEICAQVVESVKQGLDRGFSLKDMAVIVRTNSQGAEMARALMEDGIDVVTNDSLRISSGPAVQKLVAQMHLFNDPDDPLYSYGTDPLDKEGLDRARSLTDLAEEILRQIRPSGDDLYLLAFMDLMRDFVERGGNSLDAFLKYWEEEGVQKSVSSPDGCNAVTIITVHKVKGLDYPYVIIPFQPRASFMKSDALYWEKPLTDGTPFADVSGALYHVGLSGKSRDTLFHDNYLREQQMAFIDSANLWYVAMTRASQYMHLIGPLPPASKRGGWGEFGNVCEALYMYISSEGSGFTEDKPGSFILGTAARKWVSPKKKASPVTIDLRYALCPSDAVGSRLRIKSDSRDFFAEGGATGVSASNRLRGTVLHGILESVISPDGLHSAVTAALASGDLDETQAAEAEKLLSEAIASVSDRGWFTPAEGVKVICERSIINTDGSLHRPDRVVIFPDHVDIIDYKFGREEKAYLSQIRKYVSLYGRMGYRDVRAYLWYIGENELYLTEENRIL